MSRRFRVVSIGANTAGIVSPEFVGGPLDGEPYDPALPVVTRIAATASGSYRLALDTAKLMPWSRDRWVYVYVPAGDEPPVSAGAMIPGPC